MIAKPANLFSLAVQDSQSVTVRHLSPDSSNYDKRKHDLINARRGLETIKDLLPTLHRLNVSETKEVQDRMQEIIELVDDEISFWIQAYPSNQDS